MNDIPMITMFKGKNVENMTRDELIGAIKTLGRMYKDAINMTNFSRELRNRFNGANHDIPSKVEGDYPGLDSAGS